MVAVVRTGDFEDPEATGLRRSLEIITYDGARHPVYSVALEDESGYYPGDFVLLDWRPEMRTALLRVARGGPVPDLAVSYDVTTGATRKVVLPRRAISVALDPSGAGLLMTAYAHGPLGRIAALGWDGGRTALPGSAGSSAITSVDGRTLVSPAGDRRRWWVIDLQTRDGTSFGTPGSCAPIRWLDDDSVLASCYRRDGNQLTSIDLDGTSTPVGNRHRIDHGRGTVFTDGDVREVGGRSWFQAFSGCGTGVLTEQSLSGEVRFVTVPVLAGLLAVVDTRGDRLVVAGGSDVCTGARAAEVIELFDPVTGAESVLTRLGEGEAWTQVVAATEVRAWSP